MQGTDPSLFNQFCPHERQKVLPELAGVKEVKPSIHGGAMNTETDDLQVDSMSPWQSPFKKRCVPTLKVSRPILLVRTKCRAALAWQLR